MRGFILVLILCLFASTNASTAKSDPNTDENGQALTTPDDKSNFPLYAMIKPDHIYLYGIRPKGMVLYQNGFGTYFDWPGLTPRFVLPELREYDYNGDGKKEVAATLYWGSGTGTSIMDLHILNVKQPTDAWEGPTYTDNALLGMDILKNLKQVTAVQSKDKKTITLSFDGQSQTIKNQWSKYQLGALKSASYGHIVEFAFDKDAIQVHIGFQLNFQNSMPDSYYAGTVDADVNFKNNKFTLSNYRLSIDPE